jgi:hypothetical protein
MRPCWGVVWGCALLLLAAARPAWAEGDDVFQECCHRCRPAVACCPPAPCCAAPVYSYRVTTYYEAPRCGLIRRLLGRCCLVPLTSCRPCCPAPVPAPVACVPSCAPPPCTANVLPGPPVPAGEPQAPVPAVPSPPISPAPAAVPNGLAPVPAAPSADMEERHLSPVPAAPAPVTGSTFRPQQPVAPVAPQTLTPPRPPAPVRLDRIVSDPERQGRPEVEATPATLIRTPASR